MPNGQAATTLLSGAFAQRRAYLSHVMSTWNQIAITGSIVVWAAILRWPDQGASVVQFASASALTAVLLAVWRWQPRLTDDAFTRLYAVTRLCEREILPGDDLCSVSLPDIRGARLARRFGEVDPERSFPIPNTAFGERGHAGLDLFAILAMTITAIGVLWVCVQDNRLTLNQGLCVRFPTPLVFSEPLRNRLGDLVVVLVAASDPPLALGSYVGPCRTWQRAR